MPKRHYTDHEKARSYVESDIAAGMDTAKKMKGASRAQVAAETMMLNMLAVLEVVKQRPHYAQLMQEATVSLMIEAELTKRTAHDLLSFAEKQIKLALKHVDEIQVDTEDDPITQ